MNTIEIKTDKSGDELQALIWELEAFCEIKGLPQPVLKQCNVIGSADILPLSDEVKSEVKRLWALPSDYYSSPKVAAVKLIQQHYRSNGVECGIKKAKEIIELHCL
jgi:hypothetical protein